MLLEKQSERKNQWGPRWWIRLTTIITFFLGVAGIVDEFFFTKHPSLTEVLISVGLMGALPMAKVVEGLTGLRK